MGDRYILVVDDEVAIREVLAEVLEGSGYRVRTAANGQAALAEVARDLPSLVLLDMRMPALDGWGFAAAVRNQGLALTIIVMTAAVDAQRWSDEIGAQGCLSKPFELTTLLRTVQGLCA